MVKSVVLFPPPFYFETSYRTYKIISSYELARPVVGTIFLVIHYSLWISVQMLLQFRTPWSGDSYVIAIITRARKSNPLPDLSADSNTMAKTSTFQLLSLLRGDSV